ncbi:PEP-CTERM system TPR-repeat protein PrsT [Alteromonas sp. ASW11-36]|uniref:PEP-CTERM system TPR-repeat protein PrsT n=1 Tax=Alteromonas arenosi TaxID=3055817 RepID=A0ABT7SUE5_9ALTE|nr:XrtA/PEP-CTERM system TPR-repeat protein PrsT [Alteromonas sp. ASW11-36]MDM7859624.1 PEP-CTERM system TPR-repeat protein PrsT [Alteromonas sp. ASW11-36]
MFKRFIVVSLSVAFLQACEPAIDANQAMQQVRTDITAGEYNQARIQLQNLLVDYPDNSEMRQMLGDVMLQLGNYASAQKEYERARRLGINSPEMLLNEARANIRLGNFEEVIELDLATQELAAPTASRYLTYVGIAQAGIEDYEAAMTTFERSAVYDTSYGRLANVYLTSQGGDVELATAMLDDIIAELPDFTEALLLKGQLGLRTQQFESAIVALERYTELQPESREAKLFYASALVQNGEFATAKPVVNGLLREFPKQPYINQLRGMIAFNERKYEEAKLYVEKAIQSGFASDAAIVIQGLSAYQLGLYEQSYRALQGVAPRLPASHPANRVLILTQLRLGFDSEALETFTGNQATLDVDDVSVAAMLGTSLARAGNEDSANEILTELKNVDVSDPADVARIGLLKIQLDDMAGIEDLKTALASDPALQGAKLGLIDAYVRQGDFDALLKLGQALLESPNDVVLGYNTIGLAQRFKNNVEQAKQAYLAALEIEPTNPASRIYLAKQALAEQQTQTAIDYLTPLVEAQPEYQQGVRLLYSIYAANDQVEQGIAMLRRALQSAPDNTMLKVSLARALLANREYEEIPQLLDLRNAPTPISNEQYLVLVETYLQQRKIEDAEALLNDWVTAQPLNETAVLTQIAFLQNFERSEEAADAIQRGLSLQPNSINLRALQIREVISAGNASRAAQLLNRMPEDFQTSLVGQGMQGHIDILNRNFEQGLPKIEAVYAESPLQFHARAIILAMRGLNKSEELQAFMERRVSEFPRDVYTRNMLANMVFFSQPQLAIEQYEVILRVQPTNIIAANNLAWLLYEDNQLTKARNIAQSALAIKRDVPSLLDTAGQIELAVGDYRAAADLFAEAYLLTPTPSITFHYAKALGMLGDNEEALRLLNGVGNVTDEELREQINQLKSSL